MKYICWIRRRPRGSVGGLGGAVVLMGLGIVARATVLYTDPFRNRLLVWITRKFGKTAARVVCAAFGVFLTAIGIWCIAAEFRQALRNK